MEIAIESTATLVERPKLEAPRDVGLESLSRLSTHARNLRSVAMELTDTWGAAMFIMDPQLVENIFSTLGFSKAVSSAVFESVRSLAYVQHMQQGFPAQPEFTWHGADVTVLTLRGSVDPRSAMVGINDTNVEKLIRDNRDLFDSLMNVMPDYAHNLMFSPEVAARVISTFGADVSPAAIYDLAWRYGGQVTEDLEGRRGVSTQFVRSLTLTVSASI